ncbi:tripartite tricarboxylate transporter substrate binding protein [Ancylobacter sp. MQZ15Z-1]|uniref:Tripartite tricarboxylate transporter substrate binding protein n=1 Tax=Ancylobacter mangrovi TaxID=2972472 RepID=A0A9X2T5S2_9HYPH|nr:tripartite tricarboxylate transporter substrate binding protein [Ancylobacter mangrovi]MCS0495684.1 tripartite tricarboxylate transporter substrate binding protein [Ancylobacter mangrovi]
MTKIARRDALKMALAAPMVLAAGRLGAQTAWPTRPVQVITGFGPGGGGDIATRVTFQAVSDILKQPMVVENRTGGNSVVAAQAVLALPHDGYAYLMNGLQQLVTPLLMKDIPIDYAADFQPVTQMVKYPETISVAKDSPWKTFEELMAYAKANPGRIRYGTSGIGGVPHIVAEAIQLYGGVKFRNISYRVAPEIARDLVGGQLDLAVLNVSTLTPMIQSDKVRLLAVGNDTRLKPFPDVPTLAELGLPKANHADWGGIFTATGTPDDIIAQMQAAVAKAAKTPSAYDKLAAQGTFMVGSSTEDFKAFLANWKGVVEEVVREAKISL